MPHVSDDDAVDLELAQIARRVEVRRVADLSRLDDLDLHVAAAVRTPLDPASISVCAGRGPTWAVAKRNAIAEAFERYCAEPRGRLATVLSVEPPGEAITVASLIPSRDPRPGELVEWIVGVAVRDRRPVWVPAAAVFYPYRGASWFLPSTHGLAAATTWDDAVLAATLECVERDAYTRAVALASLGRGRQCPPLDPEILNADGRRWHRAAVAGGLRVVLRDLTSAIGIPTVLATIAEPVGELIWAHRGCAAALDATTAATRALGEAAQGRLVDIQGAREDLPVERESPAPWFYLRDGEVDRPGPPPIRADDPIGEISARLRADGCGELVAVDLSLAGVDWRAVRVVVPGLETWAFDPSRVGARLETWCEA